MIQASIIRADGSAQTLKFETDRILLSDLLNKESHTLETPCGGAGVCGKCLVRARGDLSVPSLQEKELGIINRGLRLACTTYALGDVVLEPFLKEEDNSALFIPVSKGHIDEYKFGKPQKYHIAIDVGTTGVSAELIEDKSARVVQCASMLNPQAKYGHDVLTRIGHASGREEGTKELSDAIIKGIHDLISELVKDLKPCNDSVKSVVDKIYVAGNTTMQHLIYGVNPEPIAKSPYKPVFLEKKRQTLQLGSNIFSSHVMTLLPSASAYVGADITAGLYGIDFHKTSQLLMDGAHKSILFIDIGTNGEIVMKSQKGLYATSTAAGPALEGMNIACGMRAQTGAIDTFSIDETGIFHFTTLGNQEAKGICGSGLIDIVAELVEKEIVLKNGRFNKTMDIKFQDRLHDKKFYITDTVYLSQKDIRQIQLAKGAIATGIELLYKESQTQMEDCMEIIIAGSFGYHLSEKNIRQIGLIPKNFKAPVSFVGNACLTGLKKTLTQDRGLETVEAICRQIEVVELSRKPEFQDVFIRQLGF